jgi:signal transduction histidine kinase
MSSSVRLFKLKIFFENFRDFFKNLFFSIGNFLKRIFHHSKTEQVGIKIKNVKNKVIKNIKDNSQNWKQRNLDDHGFSIGEEDI